MPLEDKDTGKSHWGNFSPLNCFYLFLKEKVDRGSADVRVQTHVLPPRDVLESALALISGIDGWIAVNSLLLHAWQRKGGGEAHWG